MSVTAEIHKHKEDTKSVAIIKFNQKPNGQDVKELTEIGKKLHEERGKEIFKYDLIFDLAGNETADLWTIITQVVDLGVFLTLTNSIAVVNVSPESNMGNSKSQIRFFSEAFKLLPVLSQEELDERLDNTQSTDENTFLLRLYFSHTLGEHYDLYKVIT